MKTFATALLILSLTPAPAHAAPVTYQCEYQTFSNASGLHHPREAFRLTFLTDSATKRAYIIGQLGSEPVKLVPNTHGLTFVETTQTGNVMVTAIAENGTSVHSRGTNLSGEIVPAQYYGECRTQ